MIQTSFLRNYESRIEIHDSHCFDGVTVYLTTALIGHGLPLTVGRTVLKRHWLLSANELNPGLVSLVILSSHTPSML